ncbi:unnamed protein product [Dovyalis caffra]|uniref:SGNH hydrolase-type esterase domain-containing protein n=1 Tax=Dovyalis caffra TaxID=77055 RepID=A0AAV1S3L4_9ROSI|nr:unnamed protein product [Dovyalis caffra]
MVGPGRPEFVLFGSSIVQYSLSHEGNLGFGAILADKYARKADIFLRGYTGWNSRNALTILDEVFPKDAAVQPSLVIVYFGGNDSMNPGNSIGFSPYVPLDEYKQNMKKIAEHLKSLSEKTRLIFLGVPPVDEKLIEGSGRTMEGCRIYSEACLEVCRDLEVKAIDLFNAIQQKEDWDGVHLTSEGNKIVANEIMKVLEEAKWEPSLYWKSMPSEFVGVTPFDPEGNEN